MNGFTPPQALWAGPDGLDQWFTNFSFHKNHKADLLDPTPRIFDSACLEWGLRICISSKFLGDTKAIGQGTHFEKHCSTPIDIDSPLIHCD